MEILIVVLSVMVVLLAINNIRTIKKLKESKIKYEENDKLLTKYVSDNLDMEKELNNVKSSYEKQKELEKEVKKIQEQMRLLKHDMKNHILVIAGFLEQGKEEEAKQYVSDILDKLNKMYTYVNVGNALLNYIINSKLSKAKELGIEIKAQIENLEFAYMDSMDFSALLNNVLDNAIEAVVLAPKKYMEVKILSVKGFDTICVKNTVASSVLANNPELETTKEDEGHGYGLKQIKGIVEKYDGMMDIEEENGVFVVNMMFTRLV